MSEYRSKFVTLVNRLRFVVSFEVEYYYLSCKTKNESVEFTLKLITLSDRRAENLNGYKLKYPSSTEDYVNFFSLGDINELCSLFVEGHDELLYPFSALIVLCCPVNITLLEKFPEGFYFMKTLLFVKMVEMRVVPGNLRYEVFQSNWTYRKELVTKIYESDKKGLSKFKEFIQKITEDDPFKEDTVSKCRAMIQRSLKKSDSSVHHATLLALQALLWVCYARQKNGEISQQDQKACNIPLILSDVDVLQIISDISLGKSTGALFPDNTYRETFLKRVAGEQLQDVSIIEEAQMRVDASPAELSVTGTGIYPITDLFGTGKGGASKGSLNVETGMTGSALEYVRDFTLRGFVDKK